MRYSPTHKQETRQKLLEAAGAVAKKDGFATTGVDALMASVGLTGGAFYGHFSSKDELFAKLVEQQIDGSKLMLDEAASAADVAKVLRGYLSSSHALHPEDGCALPTLGAEVARASPQVRVAVERGLGKTHKMWRDRLGNGDAAWAVLAQCVGALVLARAVESERVRKEILAANRRDLERVLPPVVP